MQPVCQVRVHESGRFGQGSHRTAHDRGSGEEGSAEAGLHDHRANVRQHRNRPGAGCRRQGLQMRHRDAGEDVQREGGHAAGARCRSDPNAERGLVRFAGWSDRGGPTLATGTTERGHPEPVHQFG
uniref:(northern house mosquito) hypothetical protein n=1 Tax=Culex pipiens TaxID=7175 RepID=A0A8D8EXT9_CULPI